MYKIMIRIISVLTAALLLTACATMIPMQANLSDQILLSTTNKNIKAVYEINSQVKDGPLATITVQKNGNQSENHKNTSYKSETAFKKMWETYFQAKFNPNSGEEMIIKVTLEDLYLRNSVTTSIAGTIFTGNTKYSAEAVAVVSLELNYKGERYQNKYEVSASDYNESQSLSYGDTTWTINDTNPTAQQSALLQSAINKSILQFDTYISSMISQD